MSYKLYSRLVGKIATGTDALGLTAPADTTTPFNEQTPGTKFMAYGEDSTSLAFNRALGALSINIDSIADVLSTPALRSEMLRPGSPGFTALSVESSGQTEINLAGPPDGVSSEPAVWVYCGLAPSALGRGTKLFNVAGSVDGEDSHRADLVNNQGFTNFNIAPQTCYANSGDQTLALSFYNKPDGSDQQFIGSHDSGIPLTVPPVGRIKSDLPPYNGAEKLLNINYWESDGLYIRTATIGYLCLRPGCFVEVQNNGDPDAEIGNNGLFRIESIAHNDDIAPSSKGSKLVLSRGNLHKVTVSGNNFAAGELVSWQSKPEEADDSLANPEKRTNFAHIMFMSARPDLGPDHADLYLSNFSGPNNFGNATGGISLKLDSVGAVTPSPVGAITNYGSVGLADQEEGADQNWSMPIGTRLYNAKATELHGDPDAGWAEVSAVIPAGYPVVFSTINNPGQFYPCSPPGFLLNPILEFSESVLQGNNYLWTKTLTTVGEQLRSRAHGYNPLAAEDASNEPFQTRQDVIATEVLLSHLHHGTNPADTNTALNGPKSPTSTILGPALWKIVLEDTGVAGAETLESLYADEGFTLGEDHLHFVNLGDTNANFFCRPLSWVLESEAPFTYTVICTDMTPIYNHGFDPDTWDPTGGTSLFGGGGYYVKEVTERPDLRRTSHIETGGSDHEFTMSYGLNAAFHAQGSSSELIRGGSTGAGNIIYVPGGTRSTSGALTPGKQHRPFTTVLEGVTGNEIGHLIISDEDDVRLLLLGTKPGDIHDRARISHEVTWAPDAPSGHLSFADLNTINNPAGGLEDIPFSSRSRSSVDDPYTHNSAGLPTEVDDQSVLGAIEAAIPGNYSDAAKGGKLEFGTFSNGVLWGADVYFWKDHDTASNVQTPLEDQHDDGSWHGGELRVSISDGYFNIGGAKNYVQEYSLDLSAYVHDVDLCGQVIIYYNAAAKDYQAVGATSLGHDFLNFPASAVNIPVAYVEIEAEMIHKVVDIRQRVCRSDQRDEIYVGRIGQFTDPEERWQTGMYDQGGMHFDNLGAALAAIETWQRRIDDGRSWTIKVVSSTVESENSNRGIEYPLPIPCDSLTIEGLAGRGTRDGLTITNDDYGVDSPVILMTERKSLFDLNGRSNLTFSNLAIQFVADVPPGEGAPVINAFVNTRGESWTRDNDQAEWREEDDMDYGTGAYMGRWDGYFYPGAKPLQENITIDKVHVSGPHHYMFWHGRDETLAAGHLSAHTEVPFDNLTISNCTSIDGRYGFIALGPSNSLESGRHGDLNGHSKSPAGGTTPYFWRNINIINCRAEGEGDFAHFARTISDYEGLGYLTAVRLDACKEVTIRDCYFTKFLKGVVFGVGNWTHYCSGTIENNTIADIYGDGITAFSESEISGIKIVNNHISSWGTLWPDDPNDFPSTYYRTVTDRFGRFSAIRVCGNDILIDGNTLVDTGGSVTNTRHDGSDGEVLGWSVTSGITITDDIPYNWADLGQGSNWWGIRITNNSMRRSYHGGAFLYSTADYLVNAVISGNSNRINNRQEDEYGYRPFMLGKTHPAFHGVSTFPDSWSGHTEDCMALDIGNIQSSTITGNVLEGHVKMSSAEHTTINGNSLLFPSTIVDIGGGTQVTFSDNQLHNATMYYEGGSISIMGNNFCAKQGEEVQDIYETLDAFSAETGVNYPKITPGLRLDIEDRPGDLEQVLMISNNTFGASSNNCVKPNGTLVEDPDQLGLTAIVSAGTPVGAVIQFTDNVMLEGYVWFDGTSSCRISGNTIRSYKDELRYVLSIKNTAPLYEGLGYSNGTAPGCITISDNSIVGHITINGAAGDNHYCQQFYSWNSLASAYLTGEVPSADDPTIMVDWGKDNPYSGEPRMWEHNRLTNVTISDNSIIGNLWMMGVQDSNIINNRMHGSIDRDLAEAANLHVVWTGGSATEYEQTYSGYGSVDLFTSGQIALLACNRVNVANCKLASLYILRSKLIRASECTFGHTETHYDKYGITMLNSSATYAHTNQGRVYASFSPHVSIESCHVTDATCDDPPDLGGSYEDNEFEGYSYMNRYDRSVYSTQPYFPTYPDAGVPITVERTVTAPNSAGSWADRNVVDVVAEACPAFTISDSHLGRAHISSSDDVMISNNRFYFGGDQPAQRRNLVIRENSMRPNLNGNHFTSSVEIGDINSWEYYGVQATTYWKLSKWAVSLERHLRFPVHAKIVGNRFDSAVGENFDGWTREAPHDDEIIGRRHGCGDLIVHNYGGSLISSNHMMKSPHGYMMHAAEYLFLQSSPYTEAEPNNHYYGGGDHIDGITYLGGETEEGLWRTAYGAPSTESWNQWKEQRRDDNNRIGGNIKLDPWKGYSEYRYTLAHLLSGVLNTEYPTTGEYASSITEQYLTQGDDPEYDSWPPAGWDIGTVEERSFHHLRVGTGLNWPHMTAKKHTGYRSFKGSQTHPFTRYPGSAYADAPEPWKVTELVRWTEWDANGMSGLQPESVFRRRWLPWGGTHIFNYFATSHNILMDAQLELDLIDGGTLTIRSAEHYPKTLGCFVIGNSCKRIMMADEVRQASWAYGRVCDLRQHGTSTITSLGYRGESDEVLTTQDADWNIEDTSVTLPAQAFETPLNPMHAHNHTQFNMLRFKDEWIDLAVSRELW